MEKITERIFAFNKDYPSERTAFKLETMAKNAFRFYRATNHIFYEDVTDHYPLPASPAAWICGDLHLENFGTYRSDNRLVYFDLNDFDEAILAPVSLELVRMVTGIMVAFKSLGIEDKKGIRMGQLFLDAYAAALASGKPAYIEPQTAEGILQQFLVAADRRKHKKVLAKKTVDGKRGRQLSLKYASHKKLPPHLRTEILEHVTAWMQQDDHSPYNCKAVDAVFRLAGAGSVGVNRYTILLESLNNKGEKYLLLDMKQARKSALLPFTETPQPCWHHEAERVVSIQQRMQNRPPALLSTSIFQHESFVMEEMQSTEDKIDFKLLKHDYREMCRVIGEMGTLTAAAQLRSSGRQGSVTADELIEYGQCTGWKETLLQHSTDYAQLVNDYYMRFTHDDARKGYNKKSAVN